MSTTHQLLCGDARELPGVPEASVHLVVTSPPYPMIEMWDEVFARLDPAAAIRPGAAWAAFEAQHRILDAAWRACRRVLVPGGFLCVNIGDATRTLDGEFALYPNHARIVSGLVAAGFTPLPDILWRKPTNAPNTFMGSGMLPAGAYVTYEHEYILVARKGGKRVFDGADKARRARSAYFWEERNTWFSDVWTSLPGAQQKLDGARARSAAFPFAIPYRLVQMYSAYGDVVLDPFVGTGTTCLAAAVSGRSSVGVDVEPGLPSLDGLMARRDASERLGAHADFVADRLRAGKTFAHHNGPHDVPVVTSQERDLELLEPEDWTPGAVATVRYRRATATAQARLF